MGLRIQYLDIPSSLIFHAAHRLLVNSSTFGLHYTVSVISTF